MYGVSRRMATNPEELLLYTEHCNRIHSENGHLIKTQAESTRYWQRPTLDVQAFDFGRAVREAMVN